MLNITNELNEFITVLYDKSPTMNTTWVQLYEDACKTITKEVFRLYVIAAKTGAPCDQTHIMTFLIYEERVHINNAKFIHALSLEQAMHLLQIATVIRTKIQSEYQTRLFDKRKG